MGHQRPSRWVAVGIAVLVLGACGAGDLGSAAATPSASTASGSSARPVVPRLSVLIDGDVCTLEGPGSIPYGAFEIAWDVRNPVSTQYALVTVTIEEGRSAADVMAWTGAAQPPWLRTLTKHEFSPPEGVTEVLPLDLRPMGAYTGGPLHIVCFSRERTLAVLGPIEVTR